MRDLGGVGYAIARCAIPMLHQVVWIAQDVGDDVADAERVDPDPVIDTLQGRGGGSYTGKSACARV